MASVGNGLSVVGRAGSISTAGLTPDAKVTHRPAVHRAGSLRLARMSHTRLRSSGLRLLFTIATVPPPLTASLRISNPWLLAGEGWATSVRQLGIVMVTGLPAQRL